MPKDQRRPDLWTCRRCGARFTTRNQRHSCGRFSLDALFARSQPQVRALYERFARLVAACGPVVVIPQKTRVAFQVRMRFAAVTPQGGALRGHLVLAERRPSACFQRIDSLGPRSHVHVFRIESPAAFTAEFARLVRAAYAVGRQEHLRRPGGRPRRPAL
jgi:hypothetical protein